MGLGSIVDSTVVAATDVVVEADLGNVSNLTVEAVTANIDGVDISGGTLTLTGLADVDADGAVAGLTIQTDGAAEVLAVLDITDLTVDAASADVDGANINGGALTVLGLADVDARADIVGLSVDAGGAAQIMAGQDITGVTVDALSADIDAVNVTGGVLTLTLGPADVDTIEVIDGLVIVTGGAAELTAGSEIVGVSVQAASADIDGADISGGTLDITGLAAIDTAVGGDVTGLVVKSGTMDLGQAGTTQDVVGLEANVAGAVALDLVGDLEGSTIVSGASITVGAISINDIRDTGFTAADTLRITATGMVDGVTGVAVNALSTVATGDVVDSAFTSTAADVTVASTAGALDSVTITAAATATLGSELDIVGLTVDAQGNVTVVGNATVTGGEINSAAAVAVAAETDIAGLTVDGTTIALTTNSGDITGVDVDGVDIVLTAGDDATGNSIDATGNVSATAADSLVQNVVNGGGDVIFVATAGDSMSNTIRTDGDVTVAAGGDILHDAISTSNGNVLLGRETLAGPTLTRNIQSTVVNADGYANGNGNVVLNAIEELDANEIVAEGDISATAVTDIIGGVYISIFGTISLEASRNLHEVIVFEKDEDANNTEPVLIKVAGELDGIDVSSKNDIMAVASWIVSGSYVSEGGSVYLNATDMHAPGDAPGSPSMEGGSIIGAAVVAKTDGEQVVLNAKNDINGVVVDAHGDVTYRAGVSILVDPNNDPMPVLDPVNLDPTLVVNPDGGNILGGDLSLVVPGNSTADVSLIAQRGAIRNLNVVVDTTATGSDGGIEVVELGDLKPSPDSRVYRTDTVDGGVFAADSVSIATNFGIGAEDAVSISGAETVALDVVGYNVTDPATALAATDINVLMSNDEATTVTAKIGLDEARSPFGSITLGNSGAGELNIAGLETLYGDINVSSVEALNVQGAILANTDVTPAGNVTYDGTISLTTTDMASDIVLGADLTTPGTVNLSAAGDITNAADGATDDISASVLNITSATAVGANAAGDQSDWLDTDVATLNISGVTGSVYVLENDTVANDLTLGLVDVDLASNEVLAVEAASTIRVGSVDAAGGVVMLDAADMITDADLDAVVDIAGSAITMAAVNGIGGAGVPEAIEIDTDTVTATNTTANGIFLNAVGSGGVDVTADAQVAGGVGIYGLENVALTNVDTADGNIDVTVTGDVLFGDVDTVNGNITADVVGDVTMAAVDTVTGNLTATVTGDLAMQDVSTGTGNITVDAGGRLAMTDVDTVTGDITAAAAGDTVLTDVDTGNGAIDVTATGGNVVATDVETGTDGNNITLKTAVSGDVVLTHVEADTTDNATTAETVTVEAAGLITSGADQTNVTADVLDVNGAVAVGSGEAYLQTDVTAAAFDAVTGDIFVSDVSGLDVDVNLATPNALPGILSITAGAAVDIDSGAGSNLVLGTVDANGGLGNITISSDDTVAGTGMIQDGNEGQLNLIGATLNIDDASQIGTLDDALDLNVDTLDMSNVTGASYLREADDVVLNAINTAGLLDVAAPAGNLGVVDVASAVEVRLAAEGTITAPGDVAGVTAPILSITDAASVGTGTGADAAFDTNVDTLNMGDVDGASFIVEDDTITLGDVDVDGALNVEALLGGITADVVATSDDDVTLTSTADWIAVGEINAGAGTVTLDAATMITDADLGAETDVTALKAVLRAANGIGATGIDGSLEIDVDAVDAVSTVDGGVFLNAIGSGGLDVTAAAGNVTAGTGTGDVEVLGVESVTLTDVDTVAGNVLVGVTDDVILTDVNAGAGAVSVDAGGLILSGRDATNVAASDLTVTGAVAIGDGEAYLRTAVGNATIDGVAGDIYLQDVDGLNVDVNTQTANLLPGALSVMAGGALGIDSGDTAGSVLSNLVLGMLDADSVSITSAGDILDGNEGQINVDASTLTIDEAVNVGSVDEVLDLNIDALTMSNVTGATRVREADAIELASVNVGGTLEVTTAAGNITATDVDTSDDDVTLTSAADILVTDLNVDAATVTLDADGAVAAPGNVTGVTAATLNVVDATQVGAAGDAFDTNVDTLTMSNVDGASNVREADGIDLADVQVDGALTVETVAGNITATSVTTSDDDVSLTAAAAVKVGDIDAGSAKVTVAAGTTIDDLEAGDDGDTDITAGEVELDAVDGIGASGTVELAASIISADTTGTGSAAIDLVNNTSTPALIESLSTVGALGQDADITFRQVGGGSAAFTAVNAPHGDVDLSVEDADLKVAALIAGIMGDPRVAALKTEVSGDVLFNSIIAREGEITITSAGAIEEVGESFTDAGNGVWDGDEFDAANDDTLVDNDRYDVGEEFTDTNGNGRYDVGEDYVDVNGNGDYEAEAYTDANGNGQYDFAEPFEDQDGNGVFDAGEPYKDWNGNGAYDAAEAFADLNGNGQYDEPFTDVGNGYFDAGDFFDADVDDSNGNGVFDWLAGAGDAGADLTADSIVLKAVDGIGRQGAIEIAASTSVDAVTTGDNGVIDLDNIAATRVSFTASTAGEDADIDFDQALTGSYLPGVGDLVVEVTTQNGDIRISTEGMLEVQHAWAMDDGGMNGVVDDAHIVKLDAGQGIGAVVSDAIKADYEVTMTTAVGDISLAADAVESGGSATLTAMTGSIIDSGNNNEYNITTVDNLTLWAGGTIGEPAAGDPLEVNVGGEFSVGDTGQGAGGGIWTFVNGTSGDGGIHYLGGGDVPPGVILWNGRAWGGPALSMLNIEQAENFAREMMALVPGYVKSVWDFGFLYFPHVRAMLRDVPDVNAIEHILQGKGMVEGLPEGIGPVEMDLSELDETFSYNYPH